MSKLILPKSSSGTIEISSKGQIYRMEFSIFPKMITVKFRIPEEKTSYRYLVESAPVLYTEEPFAGSQPSTLGMESLKRIILQECRTKKIL